MRGRLLAIEIEPFDFEAFDITDLPALAIHGFDVDPCTSDMSVVRERAEWFIAQVNATDVDVSAFEERFRTTEEQSAEWYVAGLQWWAGNLGETFVVDGVDDVDDRTVRVHLTGTKDRRWVATIAVEAEPPQRIVTCALDRRLPDGVEVREATPADSAAIAALYRRTPMVAGELRVTIDPGEDYFATTRLMEESRTLVATEHGTLIGVYCGTLYAGRLNGTDAAITLGCHSRMAEGRAGGGVWSNMNRTLIDGFKGRYDVPLAFVLTGNEAASRLTSAGAWPSHPVRAVVPCTADAQPAGRPATRADAEEVVEILNATHTGQDLFRPVTVASLTARLERAPDLYSWSDLRLTNGAVIGVGRVLQGRITEGPDGRRATRRALVFDHGVLPGAEAAYLAVLGAAGSDAAGRGATHLSVFTTDTSRTYATLLALADATEAYDVLIPGHAPDADASHRGLYVDQIHF